MTVASPATIAGDLVNEFAQYRTKQSLMSEMARARSAIKINKIPLDTEKFMLKGMLECQSFKKFESYQHFDTSLRIGYEDLTVENYITASIFLNDFDKSKQIIRQYSQSSNSISLLKQAAYVYHLSLDIKELKTTLKSLKKLQAQDLEFFEEIVNMYVDNHDLMAQSGITDDSISEYGQLVDTIISEKPYLSILSQKTSFCVRENTLNVTYFMSATQHVTEDDIVDAKFHLACLAVERELPSNIIITFMSGLKE